MTFVPCCNTRVLVRQTRTIRAHGSVPGLPVWRGKCKSCDRWRCNRGHVLESHELHWMVGPNGKVGVCQVGDCGVFFTAWMELWRKTALNASRTPEVPGEWRIKSAAMQDFVSQWA